MKAWTFSLLDTADRPIGDLKTVDGGSGEIVAQSALGGSASLVLSRREDIDWMRHRVRATFHDGDTRWDFGTYLFASPVEKHGLTGGYEVGLLSKMNIPAEDTVPARFSLPANAQLIPAAVELLQSTGVTRVSVTPSDAVLSTAYTRDAGTSKLEIINELLQAAGYWGLWCDGSGVFRIEPYLNPASRPVAHHFQYGVSRYKDDWEREQDLASVPNRVVVRTEGDAETEGLVGVAENTDPLSRFSYQARGDRWIGRPVEVVEAASQAVIDQIAARRLRDAMTPVERFKVSHAPLPLNRNDLVAFTPKDGVRRLATVQRMAVSFTFNTDVDAEWRAA